MACGELPGCFPVSAKATAEKCRTKPQKGATHRTKQWHVLHCTRVRASAGLLHRVWWVQKIYIGSWGKQERSQKQQQQKNYCKQRQLIHLMDFLNRLEKCWGVALQNTYFALSSPLAIDREEGTGLDKSPIWASVAVLAFLPLLKWTAKLFLILTGLDLIPPNFLREAKFIKQATIKSFVCSLQSKANNHVLNSTYLRQISQIKASIYTQIVSHCYKEI